MRNLILVRLLVFTLVCSLCEASLSHTTECYYEQDKGASYRGSVRKTKSGKGCQHWNQQTPHKHTRTQHNYPGSGLDQNFCRNPDGEDAPWCYTTDSGSRWEYCPVMPCSDGCYEKRDKGASYRGTTRTTKSGKVCQRWSEQSPHSHTRTSQNYPKSGLDENFCRNPDNEAAPWCYTTDSGSRWEYCPVLPCSAECYHTQDRGANYRGMARKTKSGKDCQRWSEQTPHSHSRTSANYPDSGLVDNYCRNPDNEAAPWCYTTDSGSRWEYCPVIPCSVECFNANDKGSSYRGVTRKTITGKNCQRWTEQTPHVHGNTPKNRPNSGLVDNFCRNPDGEPGPWCYTTDSGSRWELCPVATCTDPAECYKMEDKGAGYRGTKSVTSSSKVCQRWNKQTPHKHDRTPEKYPSSGLDHNFCRNPDGEDSPWCYTIDSGSRWEYCGLPACPAECYIVVDKGASYRGTATTTKSGKVCQRWTEQSPHSHSRC